MVFRRGRGVMRKQQPKQVQPKSPAKPVMKKFDESDEEDDEDISDVELESDQGVESDNEDIAEGDGGDDDEDDDDDDDDDEETVPKNAKSSLTKGNQQKQNKQTPLKQQQKGGLQKNIPGIPAKKNEIPQSAQKRKSADSALPEAKRPKLNFLSADEFAIEEKRQKERDKRSLFIAKIPANTTEEDVRALSSEIVDVRMPLKKATQRKPYAFVEFVSEAKAEENYHKFENMKLSGQTFIVDFVGEKSKQKRTNSNENLRKKTVNKLKLFVSGISPDCKLADIIKLFPTSDNISLEPKKEDPKRFAYVMFSDENSAKSVFKTADNLKLNGRPLTVLYASDHVKKSNKNKGKAQKQRQKKAAQKKTVEEDGDRQEDDDDEDDDDDDDDDDEDDD